MGASHGAATLILFAIGGLFFFDGDLEGKRSEEKPTTVEKVILAESARRWHEMEICGRGVQTYFFIVMPPLLLDQQGDTYKFESEAGHRYNCRIEGDKIVLNWNNLTGEPMFSDSTYFSIDGSGKLTVTTLEMSVSYSQ